MNNSLQTIHTDNTVDTTSLNNIVSSNAIDPTTGQIVVPSIIPAAVTDPTLTAVLTQFSTSIPTPGTNLLQPMYPSSQYTILEDNLNLSALGIGIRNVQSLVMSYVKGKVPDLPLINLKDQTRRLSWWPRYKANGSEAYVIQPADAVCIPTPQPLSVTDSAHYVTILSANESGSQAQQANAAYFRDSIRRPTVTGRMAFNADNSVPQSLTYQALLAMVDAHTKEGNYAAEKYWKCPLGFIDKQQSASKVEWAGNNNFPMSEVYFYSSRLLSLCNSDLNHLASVINYRHHKNHTGLNTIAINISDDIGRKWIFCDVDSNETNDPVQFDVQINNTYNMETTKYLMSQCYEQEIVWALWTMSARVRADTYHLLTPQDVVTEFTTQAQSPTGLLYSIANLMTIRTSKFDQRTQFWRTVFYKNYSILDYYTMQDMGPKMLWVGKVRAAVMAVTLWLQNKVPLFNSYLNSNGERYFGVRRFNPDLVVPHDAHVYIPIVPFEWILPALFSTVYSNTEDTTITVNGLARTVPLIPINKIMTKNKSKLVFPPFYVKTTGTTTIWDPLTLTTNTNVDFVVGYRWLQHPLSDESALLPINVNNHTDTFATTNSIQNTLQLYTNDLVTSLPPNMF